VLALVNYDLNSGIVTVQKLPWVPNLGIEYHLAVDGISLTIARLEKTTFDVQIVPFTWSHTNLRSVRTGDRVNLECDMVGKYVLRALELMGTKV